MYKNKVKDYRKSMGLTQKELASKVDVTNDYISQIERGRIPGMDTAQKLAKFFNTTIDELFFENISNCEFADIEIA